MAEMTIIYGVRLRRTERTSRIIVEMVRQNYCKQLCHLEGGALKFASKKPRHFLDEEDERRILRECRKFEELTLLLRVGSVELHLHLKKGPLIEVRFIEGELFGTWEPEKGLRLAKDAHPALAGDKKHIAKICSELPQGGGGIFQGEIEEPTI